MDNATTLIYDGSFNGFLTAVYKAFDENINVLDIQKNTIAQRGLFSNTKTVFTQMENAKSVWNGVQTKSHIAIRNIYFAFLSEQKDIEILLYIFIKKLFSPTDMMSINFTDDLESKIYQIAKTVAKEKKYMETFAKFSTTSDAVHVAFIKPDNDILPLISRHYRFQYADKTWLIYDSKRNYGLYYNLQSVAFISLDADTFSTNINLSDLNVKSLLVRKLHRQPMQKQRNGYVEERTAV